MIFIFWILCSFLVIALANRQGRSGFAWFIISLIVSPLIAGLLLLVYGKTAKAKAKDIIAMRKALEALESK